jgi:hypothetical protein
MWRMQKPGWRSTDVGLMPGGWVRNPLDPVSVHDNEIESHVATFHDIQPIHRDVEDAKARLGGTDVN